MTACSTVITARKEVTTTNWGNLSEWTRVEDMRRETEGNMSRNSAERKIPPERHGQEWVKGRDGVEDLVLVYEVEELLMLSWHGRRRRRWPEGGQGICSSPGQGRCRGRGSSPTC